MGASRRCLVAEGLSNGEIARRPYVSPRTAEWIAAHRRGAPDERGVQR